MARAPKKSSRPSRGVEEWAALAIDNTPAKPLPPVTKHFEEGDNVAYRGERYSVLYQNGNWVRLSTGGKDGETFVVYADLLVAIINKRGPAREDAVSEREAIRITAANDPKAATREEMKELVRKALDGVGNRQGFIRAGERLGVMDPKLREYIDEIDWSCANPGILRMRIGNLIRGRLMKGKT